MLMLHQNRYCHFNPRSLAGATQRSCLVKLRTQISIHAPSRERPRIRTYNTKETAFQSTLPRGSDLMLIVKLKSVRLISIHAPSRERPKKQAALQRANWISIHAPSRERRLDDKDVNVKIKFQSTLPRGSDLRTKDLDNKMRISIHAPSRERRRLYGMENG